MSRLSKSQKLELIQNMAKKRSWSIYEPHENNCETRHVGCALNWLLRELRHARAPKHETAISTKDEILAGLHADLQNGADSISALQANWLVNELIWIRDLLRSHWHCSDRPGWVDLVLHELEEPAI